MRSCICAWMHFFNASYFRKTTLWRNKDNANERNESLLSHCRVQLILYKDNARRVQQQGGKTKSYQAWYCRAEAYLMQRYATCCCPARRYADVTKYLLWNQCWLTAIYADRFYLLLRFATSCRCLDSRSRSIASMFLIAQSVSGCIALSISVPREVSEYSTLGGISG